MSATVDERIEVEQLEDLDFDPRCRVNVVLVVAIGPLEVPVGLLRCENPSSWIATCVTCDRPTFVCQQHYDLAHLPAVTTSCPICNTRGEADAIYRYEPLRGGAR